MHVFTSPHLINITERIQIAGKEISKKYFEFLLAECIKINDREELSFFELITAVAFLAFSKNKAEWTILEVRRQARFNKCNQKYLLKYNNAYCNGSPRIFGK